ASGGADEVVEELARALEVGDDAVNERGDQSHVARLPTEHVVCLLTEGDGLARQLVDGDDGGLVYDDAATAHGDDDRGRADVNCRPLLIVSNLTLSAWRRASRRPRRRRHPRASAASPPRRWARAGRGS